MHKHNYSLSKEKKIICTFTESFNPNLLDVIKQIYHVMEEYLRKISILGQNFLRLTALANSQSLVLFANTPP